MTVVVIICTAIAFFAVIRLNDAITTVFCGTPRRTPIGFAPESVAVLDVIVDRVAFLIAIELAVATVTRRRTRRFPRFQEAIERELILRTRVTTLGLEEIEFVQTVFVNIVRGIAFDIERLSIEHTCTIGKGSTRRVTALHSAEIDEESTINEGPNIVIPFEVEFFTALILEVGMEFGGKITVFT